MVTDDLSPFFQSILRLKFVRRAGWVSKVKIKDAESVADHSFSMCAIAMLLSDMLGYDTQKVMKMAILHDLAESVVGDYMPGDVTAGEKMALENRAMKSILSSLPKKIRIEYEKIWDEYLQNKGDVARFVHKIDKLEMALQANYYAKQGYSGKLLAQFFESAQNAVGDESGIVSEILNTLKPTSIKK